MVHATDIMVLFAYHILATAHLVAESSLIHDMAFLAPRASLSNLSPFQTSQLEQRYAGMQLEKAIVPCRHGYKATT